MDTSGIVGATRLSSIKVGTGRPQFSSAEDSSVVGTTIDHIVKLCSRLPRCSMQGRYLAKQACIEFINNHSDFEAAWNCGDLFGLKRACTRIVLLGVSLAEAGVDGLSL